jgi:2-polyprenyl-3-methyl-5-hydroxy-6-metoxy-1,4-benzoquinol methylase
MNGQRVVRLYYTTYRLLPSTHKLLIAFYLILKACFSGIWLGLLRRETLLEIDSAYYSSTKKYRDGRYNKSGLWSWEKAMIALYFQNAKRLLLVGAGGGREVLALIRLGYEVHGVECNPELVRVANTLLEEQGLPPSVQFAPPDTCPAARIAYDGLIVGWGAYMLIQGRAQRVALLRSIRAQVHPGAPLLLSFFFRSPGAKRFFVTTAIGNALRRLLRREQLELGDALEPEYVHYSTRQEIASELHESGFTLEHYSEDQYGHAIGIAS